MAKMRAYKRKYSEDEALRRFKKEVIAAARQKRRRSSLEGRRKREC